MSNKRHKKNAGSHNPAWLIGFLVCILIFAVAGGVLLYRHFSSEKARKDWDTIQNLANETQSTSTEEIESETETEPATESPQEVYVRALQELGIEVPKKELDWEELHASVSEDIYAWIYIPGTKVDYPIFQHPSDNAYYLRHNADGTEGYPGVIYSENYNSKDFSDFNTLLYGHNLSYFGWDDMLTTLHYFDDPEFFNAKDYYIYIYTEEELFVYQIFGAYEFSNIHLLLNYDYDNEYVRSDYIRRVFETNGRIANIRRDVTVTPDDRILTLCTCTEDLNFDLRYLVAGVLVNPGK